jgi:hypothetical protein
MTLVSLLHLAAVLIAAGRPMTAGLRVMVVLVVARQTLAVVELYWTGQTALAH